MLMSGRAELFQQVLPDLHKEVPEDAIADVDLVWGPRSAFAQSFFLHLFVSSPVCKGRLEVFLLSQSKFV